MLIKLYLLLTSENYKYDIKVLLFLNMKEKYYMFANVDKVDLKVKCKFVKMKTRRNMKFTRGGYLG